MTIIKLVIMRHHFLGCARPHTTSAPRCFRSDAICRIGMVAAYVCLEDCMHGVWVLPSHIESDIEERRLIDEYSDYIVSRLELQSYGGNDLSDRILSSIF